MRKPLQFHRPLTRRGETALPRATATTAACGRNREELLGPRPAGCKARSRAEAAAGSRNP
nr:MAG TPA: hypothetical protein [Herelleviridae sp.]